MYYVRRNKQFMPSRILGYTVERNINNFNIWQNMLSARGILWEYKDDKIILTRSILDHN